MLIKSIRVSEPGDPSVGIGGNEVEIRATGDFITDLGAFDSEDHAQAVANAFKRRLMYAFANIWECNEHEIRVEFYTDEDEAADKAADEQDAFSEYDGSESRTRQPGEPVAVPEEFKFPVPDWTDLTSSESET